MKLSMWILMDWLSEYEPKANIKMGTRSICGVRLLEPGLSIHDSYLHVGVQDDGVGVICANNDDSILLDTDNVSGIINHVLAAFDHYGKWFEDLNGRLWTIQSEQEILEASENVLPGQLLVISDASHYINAQTELKGELSNNPLYSDMVQKRVLDIGPLLNIEQDLRLRSNIHHTYILSEPSTDVEGSIRNLFLHDRHLGWLVVINPLGGKTRGEQDIQDELGDMIEKWMSLHPEYMDRLSQIGVFISILDKTYTREESVHHKLKLLNLGAGDTKQIYVIKPHAQMPPEDVLIQKINHLSRSCYCFSYGGGIIVVLNTSLVDKQGFDQGLSPLLEAFGCECGKSPEFADIFQLKLHYEFAVAAIEFGSDDASIRSFYSAAFSYGLSFTPLDKRYWLIHPAIHDLESYDEINNTQMCDTLRVFLSRDRNYARTSEVLHIHRSSLLYRVERIAELTGIDFDNSKTRLHLLVSFELRELNIRTSE